MPSRPLDAEEGQTVNEVLIALNDPLRREVIAYFELYADDPVATLDDVVTHISTKSRTDSDGSLSLHLVHVHLPKLSAMGWLDYDERTEQIRYFGHDEAERVLVDLLDLFTA